MTVVNLANVDEITPSNNLLALDGTGDVTLIDVADDYCAKVNSIIVANVHASTAATITIQVSIDNGSNYVHIVNAVDIPNNSSLNVLAAPIYLDETDLMQVQASAADILTVFVSYELMSD